MNIDVKIFLEKNTDLLEDIPKLIEEADKRSVFPYNDLIDTLVTANILHAADPLAKHKIEFDEDNLEELIESQIDYECRVKFMDLKHSVIKNKLTFVYVAQEDMYQEDTDKIISILNDFILDNHPELEGIEVEGYTTTRGSNKKFNTNFKVSKSLVLSYSYYIVFSVHNDEYAAVEDVLAEFDDSHRAFAAASDLANNREQEILDDYGEGYLLLIKALENTDVKLLRGDELMDHSEFEWDIWEG